MNEESLFAAALGRPAGAEREAFLGEACGGDDCLRQRVQRLLAAEQAGGILDRNPEATTLLGVGSPGAPLTAEQPFDERFRLAQKLGEGGMGEVWVADQTDPVQRRVALKVIKPGLDSRPVLARFEAERQALALMDHPNIAKVLDAGTTPTGRPYFVMELVQGVPLTAYCDENKLTLRQRLGLFVPVCQGVQHAHQKGVIHRDLKPSNVLVGVYDDQPVPKIIDFGIAKATGPKLTEQTLATALGSVLGTPEYMSPEQAEPESLDIDTRSDVYALGVMLYELLTGTTPLRRPGMREAGLLELLRRIREEEPPPPSTRLAATEGLAAVATNRSLEPAKLPGLVRGDLDWIVMKCLEKDRTRRYETANGLALDLLRHLADEVVEARPPSPGYRLGKLLRRNKGRVAATAALTLSLLVSAGAVLAVQARANRERAAAETDRVASEARTAATIAAVLREAHDRTQEAWSLIDYPDRMEVASSAALAAIRRADDARAGGPPGEASLAELDSIRQAVDDLHRHTRLVVAFAATQERFADDLTGQNPYAARAAAARAHGEALRQFGLDAINDPVDVVTRLIAASRTRDILLALLFEWWMHAAELVEWEVDGADPAVRERLGQMVAAVRHASGGPYARWQNLLDRGDISGLCAFAASLDALPFRPSLFLALARDLIAAKQYAASRAFLRSAIDRHPHDVWLHVELATTCKLQEPPDYHEALRHVAAASVLRPDSALLHLAIGLHYEELRKYDLAVAAYRKAIALSPEALGAYEAMGVALSKKNDHDGARAAFEKVRRLSANHPPPHPLVVARIMKIKGAHAEAFQRALAGLRQSPQWAEDPRKQLRYFAACLAVKCAAGHGSDAPPWWRRPEYRKQGLDLLTAELAALRKMTAERAFVHRTTQLWLADDDLASVRDSKAVEQLPADERDAWQNLWADVRDLRDCTGPPSDSPPSAR